MTWQLIKVKQTDWEQDESGYYTLINYIKEDCRKCNKACIDGHVRLDIMDRDDMPVVSFQGKASDVRKTATQWIDSRISQKTSLRISCEHASYIGAELARCELLGSDYIQD